MPRPAPSPARRPEAALANFTVKADRQQRRYRHARLRAVDRHQFADHQSGKPSGRGAGNALQSDRDGDRRHRPVYLRDHRRFAAAGAHLQHLDRRDQRHSDRAGHLQRNDPGDRLFGDIGSRAYAAFQVRPNPATDPDVVGLSAPRPRPPGSLLRADHQCDQPHGRSARRLRSLPDEYPLRRLGRSISRTSCRARRSTPTRPRPPRACRARAPAVWRRSFRSRSGPAARCSSEPRRWAVRTINSPPAD